MSAPRWSSEAAHHSPEEIERDISVTRRELGRTLDALQARLSVRRRFDAMLEAAQENGRRAADVAVSAARQFPIVTALIAVPLLLFVVGRARRWRR